MKPSPKLDNLVEKIMRLNGQHTGIYGGDSSARDVLISLRQCVVAFANERNKLAVDHARLLLLSQEIEGYIQTLQVLNTLTMAEAEKLIDDLRTLA
jgi:hypothetical protein